MPMEYVDKDLLRADVDAVEFATYLFGAPDEVHKEYSRWHSPFRVTSRDTPSFTVKRDGTIKDFGSGETYDIYMMAQRHLNIDFREAVQVVHQWHGGHGLYVSQSTKPAPPKKVVEKAPPSMGELSRANMKYPIVSHYVEDVRKVSPQVAFNSFLGGIEWHKKIIWNNKLYDMPIKRAVIPYMFNGSLHGWVTRRVDDEIIEWLETNTAGLFEEARWQYHLVKKVDLLSVKDSQVLDFIKGDYFTPEKFRNGFDNRLAMERYVEKGRRSIFGLDDYLCIRDGVYVWNTHMIVFTESELDALILKSLGVPACTYKHGNKINIPLWQVVENVPLVYLAVQNDEQARIYMRQLYDELTYVKDFHPTKKPTYMLNWFYSPSGVNDFAEAHQKGLLVNHVEETFGIIPNR